MDLGEREQQAGQLLAALDDAEFGRLLDRVGGVEAGIGKADDLGLGALRLQQEGGEVRGVERNADRADHLAALGLDEIAGVFLERIAERVVGGHEEPAIAAGFHQRAAGAERQRVGIVGPVETVGLAGVAGQARRRRTDHDVDLFLLLRQLVDRERDRRGRQFRDHVDVLDIIPAPRNGTAEIRLVLVIGGDDFDLLAEHLAAEILDRHLGGLERPFAAVIGVDPRLIVQDADLDALRRGRRGQQKTTRRNGGQQSRLHLFLPEFFIRGTRRHYSITPYVPIHFGSAKSMDSSFRGGSEASDPGIQLAASRVVSWIPGSCFARPGMTASTHEAAGLLPAFFPSARFRTST